MNSFVLSYCLNRIAICVHDVNLERGYDFLTINETTGIQIAELTGGVKLTQIISQTSTVVIAFTTDSTISDKGFNIEVWQFDSAGGT